MKRGLECHVEDLEQQKMNAEGSRAKQALKMYRNDCMWM